MVREMAGHYSSISEPDEWKVGTQSSVTFNPSLIITALRTVRILGINSTAQYAPEKLLDTVNASAGRILAHRTVVLQDFGSE